MLRAEINQALLRGGQKIPVKLVERLLKVVSRILKKQSKQTVSIAFVDSKTIRRHNRDYRGKNQITDVLSFIHNQDKILGEILICYDQAQAQAKEKGISTRQEVVLLITHGLLHLFGHDHKKQDQAKKMKKLENKIHENF